MKNVDLFWLFPIGCFGAMIVTLFYVLVAVDNHEISQNKYNILIEKYNSNECKIAIKPFLADNKITYKEIDKLYNILDSIKKQELKSILGN